MGIRPAARELSVQEVRQPRLVDILFAWPERRPVRVGACHAVPFHDVADPAPGGDHAPSGQSGLGLPGPMAFAAVAPGRPHVIRDRIDPLRFRMFHHPVVGGTGNAQYPALRRYRAVAGVGPYHACFRANTGAACFKRRPPSRLSVELPRFDQLVLLGRAVALGPGGAAVADSLHPPARRGMADVASRPDLAGGLARPVQPHDLPLERFLEMTRMIRIGHRGSPIS